MEIITCKTLETARKGGCPEDYLGIKNQINKIPVDYFSPKNVTLKNRHIDIIAPNFTNFYRQIFKILIFMFFMGGPWNSEKNEIVKESYHTLILC